MRQNDEAVILGYDYHRTRVGDHGFQVVQDQLEERARQQRRSQISRDIK